MKNLIFIFLILAMSISGMCQSLDSLLIKVEQNNPRLLALQKWLDAEETKSKTGIYPNNPELTYNYLFANSEAIGNQQELEIVQSFKLPGYYTSQADIYKLGFQQKQLLVEKEKREILHMARKTYFKLISLHKSLNLLKRWKDDAELVNTMVKNGFESGEFSKPEYDKSRIYAITIKTEWKKLQSDIKVQKQFLQQLTGTDSIKGLAFNYPSFWKFPVLDTLLENLAGNNPELIIAQLITQQSEKEIKYQKMYSLPSFELGYKSETILNQKLKGLHAGISIPLWENKNSVKYAKLNYESSEANYLQIESDIKAKVSSLYFEAKALKENYEEMAMIVDDEKVTESNVRLLQNGQISFTDYLVYAELIWETRTLFYQYENDYFTLLSKLKTFE